MTHRRAQMGGREVRARAAVGLSVRADGDGDSAVVTSGYACVTGAPYTMYDWWGDEYTEVVDTGAFDGVLSRSPDVRLLVNHDGIPLARTTSGTLTLAEHTGQHAHTGLWHQAALDGASPLVQQIRSAMTRGDLAEMSFMFRARGDWSPDWSQRNIREITELYDVSFVTFPANPGTSAQLNGGRLPGLNDLGGDDLRAAHARLSARLARLDAAPSRSLAAYRRKLTAAKITKGG